MRRPLAVTAGLVAVAVGVFVYAVVVDARAAGRGGVCSGTSHESRYLGHGERAGCATGYDEASNGGTETFCGPAFRDSGLTVSVAKRWRVTVAPCGSVVRVVYYQRGVRLIVTDQGPCFDPPGCWDNGNRDLDLSPAAWRALGVTGSEWASPRLVRWQVVKKGRNP